MVQTKPVNLLDLIKGWQQQAIRIVPPEGTEILRARGGVPGAAFFPEGYGLKYPSREAKWPTLMAIGHNFGCMGYRNRLDAWRHEDDKPTWRNLERLLADAGLPNDCCYMTNWFIGLLPGEKQVGKFLVKPDQRYEAECRELLIAQIAGLKPKAILLLGLTVVARAVEIMPDLKPWAGAKSWNTVDSQGSSVAPEVRVPEAGVRANVVALLHPSFSPPNQRLRRGFSGVSKPEVEMVRRAAITG